MTRALPLVAVLATAACNTDSTLAPSAHPTAGARSATAAGSLPGYLHSNNVKYADNGAHPATGRSGSASIMSRALLAKDGSTLVEATTGTLDAPAAPGTITKVQAKANHQGTLSTSNYNGLNAGGTWSRTFAGLSHNDQVQVQANVGGITANRNDVVTVTDAVKLRPDLAASALTAPASARVNTVVSISATVKEANHDVGARADCVLTVDGNAVTQAQGIWVDAGDAVTCVFNNTFATVGQHTITVSATNVVPADWDTANNTVSGTINIVSPEIRLNWQMGFDAVEGTQSYGYNDYWYYNYNNSYDYHYRNAWVNGWTYDATAFSGDATANVSVTSDGNVVSSATIPMPANPYDYYNCRYGYDQATNTNVSACTYPWGQTNVSAQTYSSRTTYYSENYYYGGYYYTYADNYGVAPYAVGSAIGMDVKITDVAGNIWRMEAATPVSQNRVDYDYDYTDYWYYYGYYGYFEHDHYTQWNGYSSGN